MYHIDQDAIKSFLPTHPPNFKKLEVERDFLNKEECIFLSEYIKTHSLINKRLLNSINFGSRYIFSISFNKYSKNEFLNSKHNLKPIYDIFERIKQPNTNAYFFNPLILEGLKIIDKDPNAVGYHYDSTLNFYSDFGKKYLPVCTTVLYVDVPDKFIDGNLEMHDFGFVGDHCPGTCKVIPEVGKKVVFRGDMCHRVSSMFSDRNTKRVSLVFEQYNIPEHRLNEASFRIESGSIS